MNMDFSLNLTQEQKLVMTQEMQLSVKLLQMSSFELQEYVEKEVEENPVLDVKNETQDSENNNGIDYKELIKYLEFDNYSHHNYEKNSDEQVSPFNFISEKKSLKEYLQEQVRDLDEKDYVKAVCLYIVENIDERGYLGIPDEEIKEELKISKELTEYCINVIHSLDPEGIGARDLKECLKMQIDKKGLRDENLHKIIDEYLELLAENKYNIIAKYLNVDVKKAQDYGDIIKSLRPRPSSGFYTGEDVKYVVPDAEIRKIDNEYFIIMNDDAAPKLTINAMYKEIIQNENDKNAVDYVKEKLNGAIFLIKSIEHRKSTIYRVLEKILELQRDYFDYGDEYLKPMTLKEISESLELHESTISRAIRGKYIYTSKGTIRIKDLFTTGLSRSNDGEDVSAKIIKTAIKDLIHKENKEKPLSDQAICDVLSKESMNISRRTVAKYREEIGIKSSKGRKRF